MDIRGSASGGHYLMPPLFELVTGHAMMADGYRECLMVNVNDRGRLWAQRYGRMHEIGVIIAIFVELSIIILI